jgi:hypothetical protein
MTTSHGFELLRTETIPELNTQAQIFRHLKSGAELLSLENDDENKVFSITFRTPPTDSTGLPHIMEHSVLCGSRKYPLKEPFIELVKGSLKTFLNAFTYPDKTCYPVASQNLQDFYNLVDVYLDAVFHPLIPPETLQQEGWHYELDSLDGPITFKGVVFNEMKGNYSSPESLLGEYTQSSLFPDTPYAEDSGGDPKVIPDLTYQQFKAFHETYYHPSNARIYFYGDDPVDERLAILDAYLNEFDAINVDSALSLQPHFKELRRLTYPYDIGEESEKRNTYRFTTNWLLPETTDPELVLGLQIMGYILTGTQASPLRKALIDSGLGEDLTGGGVSTHLRQMYYSTGLKGVEKENVSKAETLIDETLQTLADEGIEPDMIEAAINTVEFRLRENNTGPYPRGLILMLATLVTWLHDGDPLAPLYYEAPLQAIKDKLAAGERYFETFIKTYLIDNSHRATVILEPDTEIRKREEADEQKRLQQAFEAMSKVERQAVIDNTIRLRELQEHPDPPEALASLPTLKLSDLDKENKLIPINTSQVGGSQVLYHDLFTNGILYLDVGFNLHALPQHLLPYLNLFRRALLGVGTESEDYVKLSQRIGRKTGGIGASLLTSSLQHSTDGTAWLFLRGKGTMVQTDDLLDIMRDVLLTVKLDNPARMKQIILEEKSGEEAGLIPGGHGVVGTRLRANFSEMGWADEQIDGLEYLFFLRRVAEMVDKDWPSVLEKLEAIRRHLINSNAALCNVTLDSDNWGLFQPKLIAFLDSLPAAPANLAPWQPQYGPGFEGLTIPAQVNYVGKGANLYELGYKLDGSSVVITNYLRTTWLWEKIRVQGGAYGGFCSFDQQSGVYTYLSYRDPNLLATLDNYDKTAHFLRKLDLSQEELTKSIIGAIGQMDAYQLPDAKGYTSMVRHLLGISDDFRQQMREQILTTTAADFKAFGEVLERVNEQGIVVVLGSQAAIEKANAERGGNWLKIQKVL